MTVPTEEKSTTVEGLVLKGYFPREKWIFVPVSSNGEVLHSRFLEVITRKLRKQSEEQCFALRFNVAPEMTLIEDIGAIGARLLHQDEILFFTREFFKAKDILQERKSIAA